MKRLRSFLLFQSHRYFLFYKLAVLALCPFPIGLFLLICSITLQMKRVSILSFSFFFFFAKYVCSIWAIFLQPTVSLPPTHFPLTARVAFPKCQSDCVTLLPRDAQQLPATWIQLKSPTWFGGPAHLRPSFPQSQQQDHQVQP